jgi:hypothetical protein
MPCGAQQPLSEWRFSFHKAQRLRNSSARAVILIVVSLANSARPVTSIGLTLAPVTLLSLPDGSLRPAFEFSPAKGNVAFASATMSWAFRMDDFAKIISSKLGMNVDGLAQVMSPLSC